MPSPAAAAATDTPNSNTSTDTDAAVKPYPPTLMGLDKARRDCRTQMIAIVAEVDTITREPQLAVDAKRSSLYISPSSFRQLLPVC